MDFSITDFVIRWPDTTRGWVVFIMPWFMSSITIWMTYLTGIKHRSTWTVGLFGQVLWTTWIVISKSWELTPVNLTLWVLYYRNHRLWKQDVTASRGQLQFVNFHPPHL